MARRIDDIQAELQIFPTDPTCRRTPWPAAAAAEKCSSAEAKLASEAPRAAEAAARLATLDGDPVGQRVAMHLEALDGAVFGDGEPLLARAQTALADLPKRRPERDGVLAGMAAIATGLAGPGAVPDAIVLPKALLAERRAADEVRTAAGPRGERTAPDGRGRPGRAGLPARGPRPSEDALQACIATDAHDDALRAQRTAEATAADLIAGLPPDWRVAAEAGLPEVAEIEAVTEALRAESDHAAAATREREAAGTRRRRAGRATPWPGAPTSRSTTRSPRSRAGGTRPGPSIAPASTPGPPTPSRAMHDDDTARLRHAATTEARLPRHPHRGGRGAAGGPRGEGRRARRGGGGTGRRRGRGGDGGTAGAAAVGPRQGLRQRRDRLAEALRAARLADTARASAEAGETRRRASGRCARPWRDGAHLPDDRLPPVAERTLDAPRPEGRRRRLVAGALDDRHPGSGRRQSRRISSRRARRRWRPPRRPMVRRP